MKRNALVAIMLLGAFAFSGCAGTYLASGVTEVNRRILADYRLNKHDPDAPYVVDPPDGLHVEAVGIPELTRDVTVRQDGYISLPLLQDVEVGGLTPSQIRDKLQLLYAKFYTDVSILVEVSGYNSKFVFIYGEVKSQDTRYAGFNFSGGARFPYTGSMTVLDVIGATGGVTNRAAPWRVLVTRGDPHNPERYRIDLKKLLLEGDARQNVILAENDVVYVPPNFLAWLGYTLDNAMYPLNVILGPLFGGGPVYSTGKGGGGALME